MNWLKRKLQQAWRDLDDLPFVVKCYAILMVIICIAILTGIEVKINTGGFP